VTAGASGPETVVYTDGSCRGNPGPGGWAWAVPGGRYASGAESPSTNQRMEIMAVLDALETIEGPVSVVSDSAYVVNCFRDRWWEGWRRRGWRNTSGQPIANRDLWEPLLALALNASRPVRFSKVKGHSGDPMNDWVDQLAVEAAMTQRGAQGERPPA
jgi:ribonuclease HI